MDQDPKDSAPVESPESEPAQTPENEPLISEEELAELKKKADLAENYKARAEKAEAEAKKSTHTAETAQGLSEKDLIYLAKSDIHEDDIAEVTDYAKLKKISVQDAHKFFKPILNERAEERKTAQATQTKGNRVQQTPSSKDILEKASRGNLPQDDAGIDSLVNARMQEKVGQHKR